MRSVALSAAALLVVSLSACGGDDGCIVRNLIIDPSGRWEGRLERVQSDCTESQGESIAAKHEVTLACLLTDQPEVRLVNEADLDFSEVSFGVLGGGSFEVLHEAATLKVTIAYDNFDGDLADVEQNVRRYRDGAIECSERYRGQLRRAE